MATPTVRLIEERRFDPPRPVEVEHNGRWWAGMQYAWQLCDDHRGWMADVSWAEQHEWGLGTYRPMVPPTRVRPVSPTTGRMSGVTEHRIEVPPALPPKGNTVLCSCGDWSRTYTTDDQWSNALDAAQSHVASNCGGFEREDDGHAGNITIRGRST